MYINPFVCGVVATLVLEAIALVMYAVHANNKKK